MRTKLKVLFRVDAGHRIGLGHLQRSLSLAAALRATSLESIFFAQADSHSGERIREFGFPICTHPTVDSWTDQDAKATLAAAGHHGCDAIMVDHPSVKHFIETEVGMDLQPLIEIVARARANRIRRQVQQSAAQVLEHQDGDASANPPGQEVIFDAPSL